MIVVVDERIVVKDGYVSWFDRLGVSATGLGANDCRAWVGSASGADIEAVEAFLLGDCVDRGLLSRFIRGRSAAAVIALNEEKTLEDTLELFEAGFDDVVRKPVHVREILARIGAIRRRMKNSGQFTIVGELKIYADGRDPEIKGEVFSLPRRERRILEYLVSHRGCRVTKSQIFNSVYGLFSESIDENVIESHISKLRKRLRHRLGYDPIESQRFLGYRFDGA